MLAEANGKTGQTQRDFEMKLVGDFFMFPY